MARLGGDEFTVILSDLTDAAGVENVGRQLLVALAQPFALGAVAPRISASIGVALCPADARSADELLKRADKAMYQAKNGGKNALCYATRTAE